LLGRECGFLDLLQLCARLPRHRYLGCSLARQRRSCGHQTLNRKPRLIEMRIRALKPEFHSSFSIARLSEPAVILAIGLLNHSDDQGYFEADPRLIKAAIFPLREPSRSITGMLTELVREEYIQVRTAKNGRLVGKVVNFLKHQKINNPSKFSKIKPDFEQAVEAQEFAAGKESESLGLTEFSCSPTVVLPEASQKKPSGTGIREQGSGISSCPESAAPTPDGQEDSKESKELPEGAWRFVDWFLALLKRTGAPEPKLTESNRRAWADTYDKLIRLDGRSKDQVKAVCEWAREDSFWRSNFLSPSKLREKNDGVTYFDRFMAKMSASTDPKSNKPASLWELQQRETAIRDKMRELSEGHKGQEYVGMGPGRTSPYEWTEQGKAAYQALQCDLLAVRSLMTKMPAA
jgi:hypothetical protein